MAKKATGARRQVKTNRVRGKGKSDARQLAQDMLAALEMEFDRSHYVKRSDDVLDVAKPVEKPDNRFQVVFGGQVWLWEGLDTNKRVNDVLGRRGEAADHRDSSKPGARKAGRPRKNERDKGLKEEDIEGAKLERAILAHIAKTNNVLTGSSSRITRQIIKDRKSEYFEVPFDTLFKRVNAALRRRGVTFWHFCKDHGSPSGETSARLLHKSTRQKPSAQLLHELGLQSLEFFGRPFGELLVRGYAKK